MCVALSGIGTVSELHAGSTTDLESRILASPLTIRVNLRHLGKAFVKSIEAARAVESVAVSCCDKTRLAAINLVHERS